MTATGESTAAAPTRMSRIASLRAAYQADLAEGTSRFFGRRRHDCPWCGGTQLRTRLRTRDLLQHKPGRFVLDVCARCGHTFQNPQLNSAGLEFYYRDFYDGLGEERLGGLLKPRAARYRRRASSVLPHLSSAPSRWLDVGTGQGHFCRSAREVLPRTAFDGLDLTEGVEIARRQGHVDRAMRGLFPQLAPQLAGQYDVVSMFHYLEHSTDPLRELEAAHTALAPGGLLIIEVPDPASRYARLLGRWWLPWLQPQHLHLMPAENLRDRLTAAGFIVLAEQRHDVHDPVDLLAACWLLLDAVAPREEAPWLPRPAAARPRQLLRTAAVLTATPLLLLAHLLDRLLGPLVGRSRWANAYRLLARRNAGA